MADTVEFSIFKMFEKVIKSGIQLGLAWLAGLGLEKVGVTINVEVLTGVIFAGIEALRNVIKIKFGWTWL